MRCPRASIVSVADMGPLCRRGMFRARAVTFTWGFARATGPNPPYMFDVRRRMARQPQRTRRQRAVRLGIPGSIVAVLAIIALRRVGAPGNPPPAGAPSPVPARVEKLVDVLAGNTVGREASIDHVRSEEHTSELQSLRHLV